LYTTEMNAIKVDWNADVFDGNKGKLNQSNKQLQIIQPISQTQLLQQLSAIRNCKVDPRLLPLTDGPLKY
jgi:hypothetical protein